MLDQSLIRDNCKGLKITIDRNTKLYHWNFNEQVFSEEVTTQGQYSSFEDAFIDFVSWACGELDSTYYETTEYGYL